ncbi:MAG: flavodoxin [Congregibacter sp.]
MLIVYHSQSGASAALAFAAWEGAIQESSLDPPARAADTGAPEIMHSDGLLLVCAENSGRLAGGAKDLLDRVFYPLIRQRCSLPYALVISAGNDGRGAVREAQGIFRGIPFVEALEPLIIRGVPTQTSLASARDLGAGFAAGLAMGIF